MTHRHEKNNKTGLYIVAGIAILLGSVYLVSTGNIFARNRNNANTIVPTTSSYSCPMAKGQNGGGGCGMMGNTTTTATVAPTQNTVAPAAANTSYETVNVGHNVYALDPETVTLTAGKNYKLVITPSANGGGCMSTLTIPGIDENVYDIKKGVPITIIINNAKVGTYDVVCGSMGMYQGTIIIQ